MSTANKIRWRWDQGRLLYFDFNVLKSIASVLVDINGISLRENPDPLRYSLESHTGMPFAPSSYRVWRNYKRVFECSFLATSIDHRLTCTDFCTELANSNGKFQDVDDYLFQYVPRFRFPFPAFSDYSPNAPEVYPFCSILKLVFSRLVSGQESTLTLEDVFTYLIANNVNGTEDLDYYRELKPQSYTPKGDEKRQVREMLIFLSQMSLLKWYNKALILDIGVADFYDYNEFKDLTSPNYISPKALREEDFLSITSLSGTLKILKIQPREQPNDEVFIEGKRSRVTHLKMERSPVLRKMFLAANPQPICNMCTCNTQERYPWTKNLIEVHHVLPLSSSLGITSKGTSLSDVVGLCPNCHRSVHLFYNQFLKQEKLEDFKDKSQAVEVYELAKRKIVA